MPSWLCFTVCSLMWLSESWVVQARGKGCVRMTLASQDLSIPSSFLARPGSFHTRGHGRLQYTVDGACRPPFFKMHFEELASESDSM